MRFPACKPKEHKTQDVREHPLRWLASEPYRLFFASGAAWSLIGVSLWPIFYAKKLDFYPNLVHARLMIEAFGGAFIVGFLGTAGPRMVAAPRLTPPELIGLFSMHLACGTSHLMQHIAWGDVFFIAMLASIILSLIIRVMRLGKEAPPPQIVLALTGLFCGVAGAMLQSLITTPERLRLANLLLYQGLLLPPVLGIGSFLFPRMLGGDFGESKTAAQNKAKLIRACAASALIVGSFFLEVFGPIVAGYALRSFVVLGYFLIEVRWRPQQTGSLTTGLFWALGTGFLGLSLAGFFYPQHISIEHLLYAGGFGMLMFIVGSRVLFGHSGDLEGFFLKSKWVRFLIFLGVLASTTRATPAWVPSTTISHHIYAACTWGLLSLFWLLWHRRRFVQRDQKG